MSWVQIGSSIWSRFGVTSPVGCFVWVGREECRQLFLIPSGSLTGSVRLGFLCATELQDTLGPSFFHSHCRYRWTYVMSEIHYYIFIIE